MRKSYLLAIFLCLAIPATAIGQESETQTKEDAYDPAGISTFGQRGIFRSVAAKSYAENDFVVGLSFEFFKANDFLIEGDENQRLANRYTISWVPIEGLELSGGFSMVMNYNPAFMPDEIQSFGDPFIGVKYGYQLTEWFATGLAFQTIIPSGQKFSQLSDSGISLRLLANFDLMPLPEMLITLNVGYNLDNTRKIFDRELNDAQLFAAGINPNEQILANIGIAYQVGPFSPFFEYGAALAQGSGTSPHWVTVGVRAWPFSLHTLHTFVAADIGLTGVTSGAGEYKIPPYNILLGIGYNFGQIPQGSPEVREVIKEVIKEKTVEVKVPTPIDPTGRIDGKVINAKTGEPLGDAKVLIKGKNTSIFLTDKDKGAFLGCAADPGPVKITVSRDGYHNQDEAVLINKDPTIPVTIKLKPIEGKTYGTLKGTVRSVTGAPLRANIVIPTQKIRLKAKKGTGNFQIEVGTGVFDVLISKKGFITQRQKIRIKHGDVVILNVELYPKK
jgi:translation initiation factor IF-1